jgi:hypothetical protein
MCLERFEEKVAGFLEEWVNRQVEAVEIGCQWKGGGCERRRFELAKRSWDLGCGVWDGERELVEECGDDVGVVDLDRHFNEDVGVAE